jgi:AcrR family transcriptional regulator
LADWRFRKTPVHDTKRALVERFRRDSILAAARNVIARQGRSGASMQAIAQEAGVAKGTLYLYFRDRDDLLRHTGDLVFDELLTRLTTVLEEGRPLPESLRALVKTNLDFFDENPPPRVGGAGRPSNTPVTSRR